MAKKRPGYYKKYYYTSREDYGTTEDKEKFLHDIMDIFIHEDFGVRKLSKYMKIASTAAARLKYEYKKEKKHR